MEVRFYKVFGFTNLYYMDYDLYNFAIFFFVISLEIRAVKFLVGKLKHEQKKMGFFLFVPWR